MQCKELQAVLADDEQGSLSSEAREHLSGCANCRDLLADLSAIVQTAQRIPAEAQPPDRIWISLRTQLEAEGIIRAGYAEQALAVPWWAGLSQFFRPRVWATVAASLFVVAGGIYLAQRPKTGPENATPVATISKPNPVDSGTQVVEAAPSHVTPLAPPKPRVSTQSARVVPAAREASAELAPSPTETAYFGDSAAVLSETESTLPTRRLMNNAMVDASLRQNLRTLNEFIAECEARLRQNPQDPVTREYLNMAYQQKAELLSAMMDSGRSEH